MRTRKAFWTGAGRPGSRSLLKISASKATAAYKLKVKQQSINDSHEVKVDLLETFD